MPPGGPGHPNPAVPHHHDSAARDRFSVASRRDEDSLELALAGDLDMSATFKVEPEFDRLIAGDDVRRLVVDVGGVGFIDSAGLGALLSIRDRTRQPGIEMSLLNVPEPVRRILDLSGTRVLLAD